MCNCEKLNCVSCFLDWPLSFHPKGKMALLRVSKDGDLSWAVISLIALPKGEFVLEATGEVVDRATHLAESDPFQPLMCQSPPLYLRMKARGSFVRFLSHSCDPCLSVLRANNCGDSRKTRILLFCNRDVEKDEELTVNFDQLMDLRIRLTCECGGKACKGSIGKDTEDK